MQNNDGISPTGSLDVYEVAQEELAKVRAVQECQFDSGPKSGLRIEPGKVVVAGCAVDCANRLGADGFLDRNMAVWIDDYRCALRKCQRPPISR